MMIAVYTPMKPGSLELDLDKIPAYCKFLAGLNISNVSRGLREGPRVQCPSAPAAPADT